MQRMLVALFSVLVIGVNLSKAEEESCSKLDRCFSKETTEIPLLLQFKPDENSLNTLCNGLKERFQCFVDAGNGCKETEKMATTYKTLITSLINSFCVAGEERNRYLIGSQCLSSKQDELFGCDKMGTTQGVFPICWATKEIYSCVAEKSTKLCGENGRKSIAVVIEQYQQSLKSYCDLDPCSMFPCFPYLMKNYVVFESDEESLTAHCEKMKNGSVCMKGLLQKCEDNYIAITMISLFDTLQKTICVPGPSKKDYLDNAACLSNITYEEYQKCIPDITKSVKEGATKKEIAKSYFCDGPKTSFPCITNTSEVMCEKKGKDVMQMMLGKYTEAFKTLCGDATINTPKTMIMLIAALWLFFNRSL